MTKISPVRSPYYRVAAKALIFDDKKRLLVVEAPDHIWEMPGGGWEHTETLKECMRREIREELGVEAVEIGEVKFFYKGQHRSGNWKVSLLMPVKVASTDFDYGLEDGVLRAAFISREDLPSLNFSSDEKPILNHLDEIWP